MQVTDGGPSPAAAARRAQIVAAAIETVAELGYAQTSFAKIADRAGISSTRLISYHFEGKDDLIQAVAQEVLTAAAAYMQPRIRAATGHWNQLAAYLSSNMAFLRQNPAHLRAIIEIISAVRTEDVLQQGQATTLGLLVQGFRDGQRDGEYVEFDPYVMAVTVRAAIDAACLQYAADPGLDLDAYTTQLLALFERAIRKDATT